MGMDILRTLVLLKDVLKAAGEIIQSNRDMPVKVSNEDPKRDASHGVVWGE
jgi:hypothetical protein